MLLRLPEAGQKVVAPAKCIDFDNVIRQCIIGSWASRVITLTAQVLYDATRQIA